MISGTGSINHIEFTQGSDQKVYVNYSDEQAGLKEMRLSYLGRKILAFLLKNMKPRFL